MATLYKALIWQKCKKIGQFLHPIVKGSFLLQFHVSISFIYHFNKLCSFVLFFFLCNSFNILLIFFLVYKDLPGALDDAAITEALELHKIKNRQWSIFKTSAIKGEGLFEGLDW